MTLNNLLISPSLSEAQATMRILLVGEYGSRPWQKIDVTHGAIDAVLARLAPIVKVIIDDKELVLTFEAIEDFKPTHFTDRCEQFVALKMAMKALRDFASGQCDVLNRAAIVDFVDWPADETVSTNQVWLSYNQLREQLSDWVSVVLVSAQFIELERNWLTLSQFLAALQTDQVEADLRQSHCLVTLLNVATVDITDDLHSVSSVTDSQLFDIIYSEELGQFGGQPYHVVCLQSELNGHDDDLSLLTGFAQIASTAQCVVCASMAPEFYLDPTLAEDPLTQPRFFTWRHLVEQPISRYLLISAGRYCYRPGYSYESMDAGIGFEENESDVCWAPLHLWHLFEFARSQLAVGTPLASAQSVDLQPWLAYQVPAQAQSELSPERRHVLADLGINTHHANENFVGFQQRFQMSTALSSVVHQATPSLLDQHTELLMLQNQFARHLKMMVRESLGHSNPESVEAFTRQWLQPFVQATGLVSRNQAQRQPLSAVKLDWQDGERGEKILAVQLSTRLADYGSPVDLALEWSGS